MTSTSPGEDERHLCERVGGHPSFYLSQLQGVASAPVRMVISQERGALVWGRGERESKNSLMGVSTYGS